MIRWSVVFAVCAMAILAVRGRAIAQPASGSAGAPHSVEGAVAELDEGAAAEERDAGNSSGAFDDFDGFEDIEELQASEVTDVTPMAAGEDEGAAHLLGRLHPLTVHLPIGWFILLVLVDLGAFAFRRRGWERVGLPLLVGVVASFLPAMATGLLRYYTQTEGTPSEALAEAHRNLILATAACCAAALALRWRSRDRFRGVARWSYWGLLVAASGLLVIGAHKGSQLVFGESYLPF